MNMLSSPQDISNKKGGLMRWRILAPKLVVAMLAVFVGACAASRTRTIVIAPVAPIGEADTPEVVDILPVRQFSLAEIIAPAQAVDVTAAPSCDIAKVVAETFTDPGLASVSLNVGTKKHPYVEVRLGKVQVFDDYEKDIALRVLDPVSCTTEVIIVRKTYGTRTVSIPVKTKTGTSMKEQVKPAALVSAPVGWSVEVVRRNDNGIEWNNWGTSFHVAAPEGRIVVGLKYPMVGASVKKGAARVTSVVYVPHSEELMAVPALIERGMTYIKEQEQRVKDDLRARGVRSAAFPDMLVADAMERYPTAYPLQQLLPIEHMDMGEFIANQAWTTKRVYMVIGANGSRFATYTCSPAAACGPQQFMPASYRDMRRRFPDAGLIKDVDEGRRDAFNSMKAAALLLDTQLKTLIEMRGPAIVHDSNVGELQAAGYNTGASRSGRVYGIALVKKLVEWTEARGKRCSKANKWAECLLTETKGYIAKYRYLTKEWPQEWTVALDARTP
ncbi:MAG: hypothetical protein IT405_01200 [Candidatus Yanofskybacteria bacterium]|nr:hypothetical protein [Candidatus Yanofskybacteria bacterium]